MRLIGPNVDPLSGTVQLLAQRPEASYSFLPILREQCRTVRAPRSGRTDRRQTQQDWPSTMTHCCQFFGPRFRSSTSTHPRLNPVFVVAHLPASNLFTSTRRWATCRLVGRDGPCGPSVHGTSTYRAVDEGPIVCFGLFSIGVPSSARLPFDGQKRALDEVIEVPIEPIAASRHGTKSGCSREIFDSCCADVTASPKQPCTCVF